MEDIQKHALSNNFVASHITTDRLSLSTNYKAATTLNYYIIAVVQPKLLSYISVVNCFYNNIPKYDNNTSSKMRSTVFTYKN